MISLIATEFLPSATRIQIKTQMWHFISLASPTKLQTVKFKASKQVSYIYDLHKLVHKLKRIENVTGNQYITTWIQDFLYKRSQLILV